MPWFKRTDKGILTPTESKREVPDGLWFKTPAGKVVHTRELKNNAYVIPEEDHHVRIGSEEYFEILFDNNTFTELDAAMESADPLKFVDTKPYPKRIKDSQAASQLKDALRSAYGKLSGMDVVVACMDFTFIGGSMGSVVGEKIARAIDHSIKTKAPFIMISRSGGARMMEAGLSLMQMAKTSAKLALLDEAKVQIVDFSNAFTKQFFSYSYHLLANPSVINNPARLPALQTTLNVLNQLNPPLI